MPCLKVHVMPCLKRDLFSTLYHTVSLHPIPHCLFCTLYHTGRLKRIAWCSTPPWCMRHGIWRATPRHDEHQYIQLLCVCVCGGVCAPDAARAHEVIGSYLMTCYERLTQYKERRKSKRDGQTLSTCQRKTDKETVSTCPI